MAGEDADYLRELFAEFGPVSVRRMFGGAGVFVDGLMFGLVAGGVIHLKADDETVPAFEREGAGPFTYGTKNGERILTSYWRLPERLYDDPTELARWARDAHAVALRARQRKHKPAKASPSKRKTTAKARKKR